MTQINKTKRRFLGLKVNEISLVDLPANQKEFAVVKRLQEEDMVDDNKQTSANDVEKKAEVEEKNETNKAVADAMGKVVEMVEGLVQKGEKPEEEKPEEEKPEEVEKKAKKKAEMEDEEEEKAEEKEEKTKKLDSSRSIFEAQLTKNGIKGDALKTAMENFDDLMKEDEVVEKREETVEDRETQVIEALEASILKAKRFTPSRMKTLKVAVDTLQSLMQELTPIQSIEEENSSSESLVSGIDTSVAKSIEKMSGSLEEKLSQLVDTNKSLNDRIEAIEKVRNPSASLEEEGGTDKEAKVEKSLWADVL